MTTQKRGGLPTALNTELANADSTSWLDVPGAVRRGLVSPATIKREIRAGRLRAYKVGGRLVRLHRDDVDAWMASKAVVELIKPRLRGVR